LWLSVIDIVKYAPKAQPGRNQADARNYACPLNEAAPCEHKIISHTCIVSRHRRILVRVPTAAIAAQVMMLARVELEGAPPA